VIRKSGQVPDFLYPYMEEGAVMTNKELILKFYDEVFNQWDTSRLEDYVREDYIQHNPTVETGIEGFRKFLDRFLAIKPHMEIKHVLCEGDYVCVFFKCVVGINGMINKVFDLYRIQDGKLAEHWDSVEHDIGKITPVNENGFF